MNEKLKGYIFSLTAIIGFGGTFIAVTLGAQSFDPITMSMGRVVPAAILAIVALKVMKHPLLPPKDAYPLIIGSSLGVVVGFPLLSTLALQTVPAADAGVIGAITPMVTATVAVLIGHNKPRRMFWVAAIFGTISAMALAYFRGGNEFGGGVFWGYVALGAGVLFASMGHISGSTLIAKYPAFVVLNWAVMISIPLQLPIAIVNWTLNPITQMPSAQSWFGYLYVSLFSLAIGNFMLNKGLFIIGLIKGPQLQLIQPVVTMVLSIWVLHVAVSPLTWIAALAILISVAWSQKYRG